MKDLFLTSRGDFAIQDISNDKQQLEISFLTSKSNALILEFFIEDTFVSQEKDDTLNISFCVNTPQYNKKLKIVTDELAMEQAIRIRLLSSLGSIKGNTDIGSKLETIIHSFIDKDATFVQLQKIIKEAISDIIENPIIKIEKSESKYTDYSNTLKVTIIDKDETYNIKI